MKILKYATYGIMTVFMLFFLTRAFDSVTNVLTRDMRDYITLGLPVLILSIAALWDYTIVPRISKRKEEKERVVKENAIFIHPSRLGQ